MLEELPRSLKLKSPQYILALLLSISHHRYLDDTAT